MISISALLAVACSRETTVETTVETPTAGAPASAAAQLPRVANPASLHCVEVQGRLVIERRPDGAEFGICYFEDNRQCEEWALMRGECPVGGRRITGYATQAGRYCAITGGQYTGVVASDNSERGTCELPGGKKCDAEAYYDGSCTR